MYKKIRINSEITKDQHRLLMEQHLERTLTFNEVVHHKDGNKSNNDLDNLEVMTRSEHTRLHMREQWVEFRQEFMSNPNRFVPPKMYGINNPSSKLSVNDVIQIRIKLRDKQLGLLKISLRELARQYGVCHQVIMQIRVNISYTGVEYYPG